MGFATDALKHLFQLMQRGTRQANDLLSPIDQIDLFHSAHADDDDVTVVIVAVWRGSAGEAGIGSLRYNNDIGADACFENTPLLDQGGWTDNGKCPAEAEAKARAISTYGPIMGDDVAAAHDRSKFRHEKTSICIWLNWRNGWAFNQIGHGCSWNELRRKADLLGKGDQQSRQAMRCDSSVGDAQIVLARSCDQG
ncbi:hypothetical protein GCM10007898_29450 [Dyella flagellata]|uniref:Uncharacterized protein n=1 Tax=Dyella flagellata TaxID=1867833 RepID=A0ABQ5XEF5_9GAMM|nr:hypothetical protein GCM10007898_29450 [Dyella flagellata]